MSAAALYSSYFAELLKDHDGDQEVLPELVDDNARLPSPCFGQLTMGTESELLSCHTRSTTSTCASTMSNSSSHSHMSASSTGSNSSAGSCRWDSNPSSNNTKTDQLKRPKRPGRKTSDNNKNRSPKTSSSSSDDRPVERPSRTSSGNANSKRHDKPQRPSRTSSSEKRPPRKSALKGATTAPDSLDKMLLQSSKHKAAEASSDGSSSENSLKEIFRSASHQRRTVNGLKPLPGTTRTSPPRTVNEILGQSMEELKIAW